MKVKKGLLKYLPPAAPVELRLAVANGKEPAGVQLAPEDRLTVLFVLSFDKDPEVAGAADTSLHDFPADLTVAALEHKLDSLLIKKILAIHKDDDVVLIMAAMNHGIDDAALVALAETGPEDVVGILAGDSERLREKPDFAAALARNPNTPLSLKAALAAYSTIGEAPEPPKEEPATPENPEDGTEKPEDEKSASIQKKILDMSVAERVKFALTGNKSARDNLIKQSNKMIQMAVLKNPRITEDEIIRLASTKSTTEDIMRVIAKNKEWTKNYQVRLGMVTNAKTPIPITLKMLNEIHEKDLIMLSRSKNVPSVLSSAARKRLDRVRKRS